MAKKAAAKETLVLSAADAALFAEMKAERQQRIEAEKEASARKERKDSFHTLLVKRTDAETKKMVAGLKPMTSVRAIHLEHGEIEGLVVEVVPVYHRKGEEKGTWKRNFVDIVSTTPHVGEVARDGDDKPVKGNFYVYQVQPEWILEVGEVTSPTFKTTKATAKAPKVTSVKRVSAKAKAKK